MTWFTRARVQLDALANAAPMTYRGGNQYVIADVDGTPRVLRCRSAG